MGGSAINRERTRIKRHPNQKRRKREPRIDTNGRESDQIFRVHSRLKNPHFLVCIDVYSWLFVSIRVPASSDQCAATGGPGASGATEAMVTYCGPAFAQLLTIEIP